MCPEHHRIYGPVLSRLLTISDFPTLSQISHGQLLSIKPAPIDPVTNLNLVLVNTASAPLHTLSNHMSDLLCPGPSLCPVLTAHLAAILASSLCCPGRVSWVANPHHLNLLRQRTTDHPRSMPSITSLSDPWAQLEQRVSRFLAEIGFDSLLAYAVAPPSAWSEV